MNIFFHLVLAILLRVFVFYSKLTKTLQRIFLFDILPYSMENLKENEFARYFDTKPNRHMYFSSMITQKIFSSLGNEHLEIILFSLMDVMIGLIISHMIKKDMSSRNFFLEIYLYNPISLLNCSMLRLDIFYTLINLLFVFNLDSIMISSIFLALSSILSPGFMFINFSLLIFIMVTNPKKFVKILFVSMGFVILLYFGFKDSIMEVKEIYLNYYTVQDSLPNFGMMWALTAETFLKYKTFYLQMLAVYQTLILTGMITMVYRTQYENKFSLLYALAFLVKVNDITPSLVTSSIAIPVRIITSSHYSSFSNIGKWSMESIYSLHCSFAGITLIFSRSYPFKLRRTGSSNYTYYQNLFYIAFLVFVLMCAVHSINTYRKETNHKRKIKEIVDDVIDNIVNQQSKLE